MAVSRLEHVSQAQQARLCFIDFRLCFLGELNRPDVTRRFGVSPAAASRDLLIYREAAPENLHYDHHVARYFATPGFSPLYEYTDTQMLAALFEGFGEDFIGAGHRSLVTSETLGRLTKPDHEVLATVTRAIHQQKLLRIRYVSLTSGETEREIAPFALADTGQRWHLRAWDRLQQRFSDFVLNRIITAEALPEAQIAESERKENDNQWNRIVELQLAPHPALAHAEAITREYHMQDNRLQVNVRAALAGYLLRRWNVDCSENHSLTGAECQLCLGNRPALYGVENLVLAPGYGDKDTKDSMGR